MRDVGLVANMISCESTGRSPAHSALEPAGASGDLAKKKTYPALCFLYQHG